LDQLIVDSLSRTLSLSFDLANQLHIPPINLEIGMLGCVDDWVYKAEGAWHIVASYRGALPRLVHRTHPISREIS